MLRECYGVSGTDEAHLVVLALIVSELIAPPTLDDEEVRQPRYRPTPALRGARYWNTPVLSYA